MPQTQPTYIGQGKLLIFFESVKVVKDKDSLKNCYRLKETKEKE